MSFTQANIRDFFANLRSRVQERQQATTDPALREQLEWFVKCIETEENTLNEELKQYLQRAKAEIEATIAEFSAPPNKGFAEVPKDTRVIE